VVGATDVGESIEQLRTRSAQRAFIVPSITIARVFEGDELAPVAPVLGS
jgi:hypothetical protein